MTSNRFGPRFAPLRYDPARRFVPFTAISRTEVIAVHDRFEAARSELFGDLEGQPGENLSLVDSPQRMLADYQRSRRESELGRMLALGKRLREAVDRVVILSAHGSLLGVRALFAAACHPYHNELSRGDRGGRPRIYFVGGGPNRSDFDNDALQALLDLLCHTRRATTVEERWALIAIDCDGNGTAKPDAPTALPCLLAALERSCGGDREAAAELLVPIAVAQSSVVELVAAIGCHDRFSPPTALMAPASVLMAPGLVPAAAMGIDIVALLKGAAMIGEQFRTAPPGDNPALDFAAVSHVAERWDSSVGGGIVAQSSALAATATWCTESQLQRGRQLEHELQYHGDPLRGGFATQIIVDALRRDRLLVPESPQKPDGGWLTRCGVIHLPSHEESSLGQLLQMMLLAAEIRRRLGVSSAAEKID
ncbi:MAG TPA: hypothetical protein VHX65_00925 [Pirellulales bacterium]|nr:hypothetical protein [Pirellulales bacterium]